MQEAWGHRRNARRTDAVGAPPFEVGVFDVEACELYYEIHGHGPRVLVFMHGILMDSDMNRRLATDLAATGHRVILLDLPGHGRSEKPKRASFHRMDTYAEHVVALLDHLGIDRAVVGGVSLGCQREPPGGGAGPRAGAGTGPRDARAGVGRTGGGHHLRAHAAGRPLRPARWSGARRRSSAACPGPATAPLDSVMNSLSNDPTETAAVLHGILAGPIAPTVTQRAAMDIPALVIGHRVDRIHPFHDAEQLARRLPQGRLVQANSVLELRVRSRAADRRDRPVPRRGLGPPAEAGRRSG